MVQEPHPESPPKSPGTTSERHSVAREVAQETTMTAQPRQDEKVWYADGNVVIIAQETSFRVHKSVIALHSTLLERMLQPKAWGGQADSTDTFDGLPTVRVSDTAYDFKQFLLVVYDGFPREKDLRTVVDFAQFAAWLRVGHKYRVQKLVIEGMRGFRSIFPMDLGTWDKYRFGGEYLHPRVAFTSPNAIEALNVIRHTRKVLLLPAALYTCAQLSPATLLAGTTRADGTPEKLSTADLHLCFELKERLRLVEAEIVVQWPACDDMHMKTCRDSGCATKRRQLRGSAGLSGHPILRGDPLYNWVMVRLRELTDEGQVCEDCLGDMRWTVYEQRSELWNKLPGYAGVEGAIRRWGRPTQGY